MDTQFVSLCTKKSENPTIFGFGIKKAPVRCLIVLLGPRFELGTLDLEVTLGN